MSDLAHFQIDRDRVVAIDALIRPYIRRTPILEVDPADFGLEGLGRLTFKLEYLQHAGSFKARGAFTHLLTRDAPNAGVVAASGGNHGAAVAWAFRRRFSCRPSPLRPSSAASRPSALNW